MSTVGDHTPSLLSPTGSISSNPFASDPPPTPVLSTSSPRASTFALHSHNNAARRPFMRRSSLSIMSLPPTPDQIEHDHKHSIEEEAELRVTFFPPLYIQRRIWVLNALRREAITDVLDVGCGEGELLAALSQPAMYLAPEVSLDMSLKSPITPFTPFTPSSQSASEDVMNLHCTHISGLDVSSSDLEFAAQWTAPPKDRQLNTSYMSFLPPPIRWEELEVDIWRGGLERFNEEFVGRECITAMEVIEHLTPNILPLFAPVLMGVYHPKHILITTPSYTFNQRFYPPQENPDDPPPASRGGYPDPTGRTNRVFRHSDHKFEWTQEEFAQWCNDSAQEWGYEVKTLTAIGRASEDDPWGRDSELGGASQVAHLVRLDDDDSVDKRRTKAKEVKKGIAEGPEHQLVKRHYHRTHPSAHKPQSKEEIAQAVHDRMMEDRQMLMMMEELWMQQEISTKCGGYFERLIDALATDERFQLLRDERKSRREWSVRLTGDVLMEPAIEVEGEWEPQSVGEQSWELDSLTEEDELEEMEEDTEGETPEASMSMGPEDAEYWHDEDDGWDSHEAYWRKANTEAWATIDPSGWDNTHAEEESVDHSTEHEEEGINA